MYIVGTSYLTLLSNSFKKKIKKRFNELRKSRNVFNIDQFPALWLEMHWVTLQQLILVNTV